MSARYYSYRRISDNQSRRNCHWPLRPGSPARSGGREGGGSSGARVPDRWADRRSGGPNDRGGPRAAATGPRWRSSWPPRDADRFLRGSAGLLILILGHTITRGAELLRVAWVTLRRGNR